MNFYIFISVTAIAVSLDGMLAGFAMGVKSKFSCRFPLIAAAMTFLLCAAASLLGTLASGHFGDAVCSAGAVFLILMGAVNFFRKESPVQSRPGLKESFAVGTAVAADAAVANLSVCLMGYDSMLVPLFFAAAHFVMVSLGYLLANVSPLARLRHTGKIAGALLAAVGILKLLQ